MNNLTIQQATQGLCAYALSVFPDLKEKGVVIGFDARHHSSTFAKIAAAVWISKEVPVYLFPSCCATPHVPFTVRLTGAKVGIMVTASHNPKVDNGYKVYWANSAQIVSPTDKHIQQSILENLQPWDINVDGVTSSSLHKDAGAVCWASYCEKVASVLSKKRRFGTEIPQMKVVYTAMHGVGYRFIKDVFSAFGLMEPVPCEEQVQPDPDFPTAAFPNPEEKGTLDLAMKTAEKNSIPIVIATDPDSDRCTFVEWDEAKKAWHRFTGDEIGAIFAYRQLCDWKEAHPGESLAKIAMVNSAVSSRFIDVMGKKEGFHTAQTLTGFKWIGNRMLDFDQKEGIHAVFGYEEAIGYCLDSDIIVDKDGLSASATLAELIALTYMKDKKTMQQLLNEIYAEYGIAVSNNSYLLCYEPPTITKIFNRIRALGNGTETDLFDPSGKTGDAHYPKQLMHPETKKMLTISSVRDLHTGFDSTSADHVATLPVSPEAEMLTLTFTNGAVITVRTSGTEPKIKWYSELTGPNRDEVVRELQMVVDAVVENLLQPKVNNLLPPIVQ
eukprot:MONOS_10098.1-p1 / transcript=MONOS_10098.1 / gene=MONOS_10098 / organism=Monocercomonoides_exilis_PA203 / gene_product=phosphoglucomutase (PGM) / transcript_product=phosphoglucomutase (PGM) / location=Mono_scaffold00444:11540-13273(+) / protein_length=554 / sequence_SO=supercontig / SO=protein_coding / is_pseudo=false